MRGVLHLTAIGAIVPLRASEKTRLEAVAWSVVAQPQIGVYARTRNVKQDEPSTY